VARGPETTPACDPSDMLGREPARPGGPARVHPWSAVPSTVRHDAAWPADLRGPAGGLPAYAKSRYFGSHMAAFTIAGTSAGRGRPASPSLKATSATATPMVAETSRMRLSDG